VRYLGLFESVKIRLEGYPLRIEYEIFFERYYQLVKEFRSVKLKNLLKSKNIKGEASKLIKRIFVDTPDAIPKILFGKKKIYMKLNESRILDEKYMQFWQEKKIYV